MWSEFFIGAFLWTLFWLAPTTVGLWVVYFLLSLPLRRQERAALFLDLIESGAQAGQAPEHTLAGLARSRDGALGARFHWLASLVESGLRLDQALDSRPDALPPRIRAMLQVGLRLGDIRKVLPVCRRLNTDATSMVLGGSNYAVLVLLALSPAMPVVFLMFVIVVIPKFRQIFHEMGVAPSPLLEGLTSNAGWLVIIMTALILCAYAATIAYIGGPRLSGWIRSWLGGAADRFTWAVPWKRRRLKRDFTAILALLLDEGVPEAQALQLAAEATANAVLQQRARTATQQLESGRTLAESLSALDEAGEFQWRLRNAVVGRIGFMNALRGWLDALEAKAFQQEQVAAQVITTALVLFNGLAVGLIVTAAFQPLTALVQAAALW